MLSVNVEKRLGVKVGESTPDGAGLFVRATLKPHIQVERGADLRRIEKNGSVSRSDEWDFARVP